MIKSIATDALQVISTAGAFVVCAQLFTDVEVALPLWLGWTLMVTPIAARLMWLWHIGD